MRHRQASCRAHDLLFYLFLTYLCSIPSLGISSSDVASVMGNANLVGGSAEVRDFDLTVVTNETSALFALEVSSASDVGWISVGVGAGMPDADIYVGWPTGDGEWTLSHRGGADYVEPEEVDSSELQLIPDLCTQTTLVFLRPLDMAQSTIETNSEFQMIWASCESRPDGSSSGATLEVHETGSYGSISFFMRIREAQAMVYVAMDISSDLEADSGGSAAGGNDNGGNSSDGSGSEKATPSSDGDDSDISDSLGGSNSSGSSEVAADAPAVDPTTLIIAHAIMAVVAWIVFTPIAVLFGRFKPYRTSAADFQKPLFYWLHTHERLQYTTLILTIVLVALGVVSINEKGTKHFSTTHQLFGVIFLGLVVGQVALGWIIHALGGGGDDKRSWPRCLHIVLGLTLVSTGIWQCSTGWELLPKAQLDWPSAVRSALGAAAIVALAAYAANVVASLGRRKSLIKNYNMRASKIRLPESDESAISRTRTLKLQRDIAEVDERARSFSQMTAGQSPPRKASLEKRSVPAYGESNALPSSMPWGVAHYPYQPESAASGFGWSQPVYY